MPATAYTLELERLGIRDLALRIGVVAVVYQHLLPDRQGSADHGTWR